MNPYYCKCCEFSTINKTNFTKHLKTKKHLKISQKLALVSQKLAKNARNKGVSINDTNQKLSCDYCNKIFKHKSSLSKHVKYACKKNKDEDLKELVRLLNEQNPK